MSKADFFFKKSDKWREVYRHLREIVLDCGLTETLKWGVPCYTFDNKNVVLIHGFKDYCALLFMKGALLKDDRRLLIQQTAQVQSARQIRFTSAEQALELEPVLKSYIMNAVEVEKSGVKVALRKTAEYDIPEEFQRALDEMPELKKAFEALTPGRQRGYLLYFAAAKQTKTREARVEKFIPQILEGKGLED